MVGDPVGDFIIQLKNAGMAGKTVVAVPYSKFKHAVASKLEEAGYLSSVAKRGRKVKKTLEVELSLDKKSGTPKINKVERVSKPGRRIYQGTHEIKPVRNGRGEIFLSTPKGVLSGAEAKRENVGGEALFKIW